MYMIHQSPCDEERFACFGCPGATGATGPTGATGATGGGAAGGKLLRSAITPILLDSVNRTYLVNWDIVAEDFGMNFDISVPTAPAFSGGAALYTIYVNLAVGVGTDFAGQQINLDLFINNAFTARDILYTLPDPPKIMLFKIAAPFAATAPLLTAELQLSYPFGSDFYSALVYVDDSYLAVQKSML